MAAASDSFLAVVASLRSLRLFSFFVTSSSIEGPFRKAESQGPAMGRGHTCFLGLPPPALM